MSYSVLEKILAQVNKNAFLFGKYWFVLIYTLRIVITAAIANPIYSDEQSSFKCNTLQVGCENVCFNEISPMSQIRFWTVQIILTSSPTIIFLLWAMNSVHCMNNLVETMMDKEPPLSPFKSMTRSTTPKSTKGIPISPTPSSNISSTDHRRASIIQEEIVDLLSTLPSILIVYVLQILVRIAIEGCFIYVQYRIYGLEIYPIYDCHRFPCRVLTECYMSRPREKTVFMLLMYIIGFISIFLSLMELVSIGFRVLSSIFRRDLNVTCCGAEISLSQPVCGILTSIEESWNALDREIAYDFYTDPVNQDLRLQLPIEKCLLFYKTKLEDADKEAERDDDQNEDEELDNLEDDYAYYYNSDNEDDDDEDEVKGQKSVAIE